MYPPHVTDQDIQLLIRELTTNEGPPSGAKLRAALHDRFGSRGGVSRVYRLLAAARTARTPPASSTRNVGILETQLQKLKDALALADHREQTHQSRWAMEVDRLRQQIAALEPLALKTKAALDAADLLRHQLHASHVRITMLEQQLLEARGREGQGG